MYSGAKTSSYVKYAEHFLCQVSIFTVVKLYQASKLQNMKSAKITHPFIPFQVFFFFARFLMSSIPCVLTLEYALTHSTLFVLILYL